MNKVGLCTIAFKERSLEDVLELASDIGFDGIELWGKQPHDPKGPDEACEIKEQVDALGLEVGVYGSYLKAGELPDESEIVSVFDKAVALGAPVIRVWAGSKSALDADASDWDECLDDFRTLCNYADKKDLQLAIEMHDDCLSDTAEGAIKIVEEVGAPCLGLNYQPLANMDVDEYARLDAVAKYVINVHAQNFTRSSGDCQRTRIREGDVDYKRVYRMLQGAGFEGYMEVEFVCGDNFEEKVKALRKDYRYLRGL